jgi:hypothetical protein
MPWSPYGERPSMVFPLMLGDVVRESDMGALLAEPDGQPNGSG